MDKERVLQLYRQLNSNTVGQNKIRKELESLGVKNFVGQKHTCGGIIVEHMNETGTCLDCEVTGDIDAVDDETAYLTDI